MPGCTAKPQMRLAQHIKLLVFVQGGTTKTTRATKGSCVTCGDLRHMFPPPLPQFTLGKFFIHFVGQPHTCNTERAFSLLPSYQQLFQRVHLADYSGCDQFLQMVASRLGVAVPTISNANPIRKVRGVIRSRYKAHSRFVQDFWTK